MTRKLALWTVLLACLTAARPGQSQDASLTGSIADPSGMPVSGASVRLTNLGTDFLDEQKADPSGNYVFESLRSGEYSLVVEANGFKNVVRNRVVLRGGEPERMDFKLEAKFMNWAHVHLLLNHFPTIGFGVGLGLFLVALIGRSEGLKRAGLVVFFLVAVLAIPTYVTGSASAEILKYRTDISERVIRAHEDAALLAFMFMEITGFFAWLGIWQFRLISRVARWNWLSVLVLSILTFVLMARAANIGGEIHHPEIQAAEHTAAASEATGVARSIGEFVTGHTWMWPSCETLHFVGLSILFTVVLIVDLRMLGMAKSISFAALYQLLPLGILGFGINLLTGMLFFIATPEQYTKNGVFYWKMLFVVLGGINVLYFMLVDEPWKVGPGDDAPLSAKFVAASAIVLWVGVLFCGHMLPFIGNSF